MKHLTPDGSGLKSARTLQIPQLELPGIITYGDGSWEIINLNPNKIRGDIRKNYPLGNPMHGFTLAIQNDFHARKQNLEPLETVVYPSLFMNKNKFRQTPLLIAFGLFCAPIFFINFFCPHIRKAALTSLSTTFWTINYLAASDSGPLFFLSARRQRQTTWLYSAPAWLYPLSPHQKMVVHKTKIPQPSQQNLHRAGKISFLAHPSRPANQESSHANDHRPAHRQPVR